MRFLKYLTVLLTTAFLAACGGGGGSPGATPNDQLLFTTAPGDLTMRMGTVQGFTIGGGRPPYNVVSNNSAVVVGGLNGTTLTIGGVAVGSGELTVRDAAGATVTVGVDVTTPSGLPLATTAPSSLTIAPKTVATFSITGGVAPYVVTSDNSSIVRVTQSGTSYTLTGVAIGAASVQIRDAVGASVAVAISVDNTAMSLNPSEANTIIGLVNYSYIIGGVAPYTVISGFPTAVTASIGTLSGTTFTPNPNGNVVRMVANQGVDPAQVIVTDSTGNSVNFELTAEPGSPSFTFAPSAMEISEHFAGDITLLLYGATPGTVNVFTTFPNLVAVTTPVTASASTATAVTISPSGAGICSSGVVVITAVDSVGAIATAEIAIVDDVSNNAGCEEEEE